MAKRFDAARAGWAVREFRRPLAGRELARIRGLVERAGFWGLPPPNPRHNLGLDGARYLFEARTGGRYHLVQRWSPDRGAFARLCRHCESLYQSAIEPRRSWWQLWR